MTSPSVTGKISTSVNSFPDEVSREGVEEGGGKWGRSGWVKAVGVGGGSGGLNETYTAPVGLSRFVFNIMI